MSGVVTIDRLGGQGDGIAGTPDGPVYVPYALPGEKVNVARGNRKADIVALLEASPLRVEPACRHFGTCGGCALQHLRAEAYRDWKRERLVEALRGHAIDCTVDALAPGFPGSRRRAAFTARKVERGVVLGFNAGQSHTIVDVGECPVLLPSIVGALDTLRALAAVVATTAKPFRLTVTQTASGLDVAFGQSGALEGGRRREAVDFCIEAGLARLSVDGEIVVEPKKPVIMVDDVAVAPPPGAFLQAVEQAEQAMAGLVGVHLRKAKRVADLFAGIGTFALRLAKASEVHAVEGDAAALASLDRAARFGSGLRTVTTERRDLFRRPLTWKELDAGFDGLVFDPPRAGAEAQATQIARSGVRRVAAVSCNPVTLARDLRILVDGGYRVERIVPVDQFVWSPHLEAVALLGKPPRRR